MKYVFYLISTLPSFEAVDGSGQWLKVSTETVDGFGQRLGGVLQSMLFKQSQN
jgi:hypothetical protein